MRRMTETMDMHTTRRALQVLGREEVEWADTKVPGLIIRVRKTAATWALRGRLGPKQSIFTIGPVTPPGTENQISVTDAREWAREAKKMLSNGTDPTGYLKQMATGAPVERTFDPEKDGLTWKEGKAQFLAFIKKHRSPKTWHGYYNTLNPVKHDDFKGWDDRLLRSFTDDDVKELQHKIFARSIAQAHLTLRTVKSAFSYLADLPKSGIKVSPARDVKPIEAGRLYDGAAGKKLGKVLAPETIGKLMWRLADYDGPPTAKLAAAFMLFTAQRIETVLATEKAEIEPKLDGGMWDIPAAHMKSKREHILPLTPTAWHLYRQALALGPAGSKLLFPQMREGKKGKGKENHMSYGTVRRALGSLAKPHDDRRSFGTHGETLLGLSLVDIAAILDHAEGRSGNVTAERYALGDRSHFKWKILSAWEAWVLEQVRKARPPGVPNPLPDFLMVPPARNTEVEAQVDKWLEESTA